MAPWCRGGKKKNNAARQLLHQGEKKTKAAAHIRQRLLLSSRALSFPASEGHRTQPSLKSKAVHACYVKNGVHDIRR
jgi:hypothetical protein